jgi:RNA 2',3'-cyclic 3'-phosphodiesterase
MEKRLFISIPISGDISEILEECGKNVRVESIRWIPKQNIHITLYFLGDVKEDFIPNLVQNLEQLYSKTKNFNLSFEKITFAPPNKQASMIWAQFHKNSNYESLLKQTEDVIKKSLNRTTQYNSKELIPHITLARFKIPINTKIFHLKQPQIPELQIDSCKLMESELNSNGSIYTTIAKFSFNKS